MQFQQDIQDRPSDKLINTAFERAMVDTARWTSVKHACVDGNDHFSSIQLDKLYTVEKLSIR